MFAVTPYTQAVDAVRQAKIAEVLGTDYAKNPNCGDTRKRSNTKEVIHVRRDSLDSVAYDRGGGNGLDEVSIGVEWSGDGVSTGTLVICKYIPTCVWLVILNGCH